MNLIEIPKKNKEDCINSFTNFILKDYSLDNLYKLSMIGELGEKNIRDMAWKIFMEVLPANDSIEKWVEKLEYLREEYKILSDKMTKKQNFFKKEEENKNKNIIDINNIKIRKNSLLSNPYHEEKEAKKLIDLDLDRTFQELALFHNEEIKNKLSRVLFIWNNENPDLGYQQGMNDIVSIIFLCLYPYYFPNEKKISIESIIKDKDKINKEENSEILYIFFHDEEEFESDLYICFNHIMKKGVKSLYDFDFESKDKQIDYMKKLLLFKNEFNFEKEELDSPLNLRCNMLIKEKLKKLDYELYNHFNKIGLDCTIFLQRWLKCIFNREFELKEVFIIWDAVIASPEIQNGYNLSKIDLIALSMILRIRNILILCDQNQCFMMLLQYPRIESILELIIFSDKLKEAILDINKGKRSLFLENVKNFIINYKNNKVEDKKVKNSKNNTSDNLNNNDYNKEISPIKSYEEGVERLGNIFVKYHSQMNISDEKEFLNILQFFNNYK